MTFSFNGLVDDGMTPKVDPYPWMKEKKFTLVKDLDQLKEVVDAAIEAGLCALDLETTGLDSRIDNSRMTQDKVVGYCISYDGEEGIYVPVGHVSTSEDGKLHRSNLRRSEVGKEIKRLCENCVTIYHNSTFDLEFLYGLGRNVDIDIDKATMFEDTLILDYLRDSTDKRHGLKYLSKRFLGMEMIDLKQLFRSGTKDRDFSTLDPNEEKVLWYAGSDAICTYLLLKFYKEHPPGVANYPNCIPVQQGEKSIYEEQQKVYLIEKSLIPALRWTERNRPKVDLPYIKRLQEEVSKLIDTTIEEIKLELWEAIKNPDTGKPLFLDVQDFDKNYDVTSPQQLGNALEKLKQTNAAFGSVKLEKTEKSKQVQTNNEAVERLADKYGHRFPFLKKIQTFRKLQKAQGTYITPLLENTDWEGNPEGPRKQIGDSTIRFRFLPHRVDTGRFAASKGRPAHGYSGINVQSTPACYNYAKFNVKKINDRPEGPGDPEAELVMGYRAAVHNTGFMKLVEDNHFIQENRTGQEYCIRDSCEGCPFLEDCDHDEPEKKKFYSLEAAVRPALVARDGYVLTAIDYSGLELRVAANICEEPQWIEEFYRCGNCGHEYDPPEKIKKRGDTNAGIWNWKINERPPARCETCGSDKIGDLHTLTAKIIYGDGVTDLAPSDFKLKRGNAKATNFAIIYGGGGGAIARATGVDSKVGWEIRNKILKSLEKFNQWMEDTISSAHKNGEVSTIIGRKIRLHNINSSESWLRAKQERNSVNGIVQGSATGDLIKYAMGSVYRTIKERNWWDICRMVLTVHDEIVFEIREDKLDEVLPVINKCMTEFGDKMNWPIPLATDIEFSKDWTPGHDWREIHNIDQESGLACDPTPEHLVGKIKFEKGMWYKGEDREKYVWDGSEFLSMAEFKANHSPTPTVDENEDGEDEETTSGSKKNTKETDMSDEDNENDVAIEKAEGTPQKPTLPVYEHKTLVPLTEESTVLSYLMRLQRVKDGCKAIQRAKRIRPTHTLCVKSVQGDVVLGPEEGIAVDPQIFEFLAFYEGI